MNPEVDPVLDMPTNDPRSPEEYAFDTFRSSFADMWRNDCKMAQYNRKQLDADPNNLYCFNELVRLWRKWNVRPKEIE